MPKVRLFASLREAAGASEIDVDAATVGELLERVAAAYGGDVARQLPHCSVVVNGRSNPGSDATVADDDEIALLPPVSGGGR